MLKTFSQLLGDDISVFHRYVAIALIYSLICGLSILMLGGILSRLILGDMQHIGVGLGLLFAGIVLCWYLRRIVEEMGIKVGIALLEHARLILGQHVASLPIGWFTPQNTAKFNHLMTQGMMSVAQLPAHVFTPLITGVITPLVIIVGLLLIYGILGLIALLAIPLIAGVFWLSSSIAKYADETYQQRFAETSQRIVEFAQSQSVFRAFSGEGNSQRFLDQAIDQQRQASLKLILLSSLSSVLNTWLIQAVSILLLVTILMLMNQQLTGHWFSQELLSIAVSLLFISRIIDAWLEVASYSEVLRSANSQLQEMRNILNLQGLTEGKKTQQLTDASIEFKDVDFQYTQDGQKILQDISLLIPSGEMMALIGASGSGKTTLAKLIARFFDVSQGQVLLGGVDVKQLHYSQLSQQISQIFQDNYLFAGTIAENIRIGRPDATDADIMQVVEQVGISEMITRLPEGLETRTGEGGARLSGGERQRIAIARALLKDAPILLVDEATAALDMENQAIIAEVLNRLRGEKTILVIAHQLSTIATADQIVVLDNGKILEQGTPAQLRSVNGYYAHYLQQSQRVKGWSIGKDIHAGAVHECL
ncbi:ABC transporter ATP-binding protein [Acinetobacter radioresistens]|uniref:ABC transporter ATP-binding protein n=1 Tax=Acinetobacter radioresistens TaxID=40216 RepID=UPI0009462AB6|nr:ABC transporter ATP-binding protein [Acinetobacter radioresistens]